MVRRADEDFCVGRLGDRILGFEFLAAFYSLRRLRWFVSRERLHHGPGFDLVTTGVATINGVLSLYSVPSDAPTERRISLI